MKLDRSKYLAFVAALGGISAACSSSPSTGNGSGSDSGSGSSGAGTSSSSWSGGGASSGGSSGGASSGSSGGTTDGAACVPCPTTCCAEGAICVDDGLGNKACRQVCTDSAQCPTAAPSCSAASSGLCGTVGTQWACLPQGLCANQVVRCSATLPCPSGGACAPYVESGNPVGPYVCKPNDGHSYDGCGTAVCNGCATSGFSCAKAGTNSFYFCGKGCSLDSDCPSACCLPTQACGFCGGVGCAAGVCGPCSPDAG